MPIPKGELDIFECPEKAEKIWSHPSVFGYAAGPKAESHPVSAEKVFLQPSTLDVVKKNHCPPQAPPENDPEDDKVNILPGTTAITEEQPGVEVGEDSCFMDTKMDTGGPPLVPGEGSNSNRKCNYILICVHILYIIYIYK